MINWLCRFFKRLTTNRSNNKTMEFTMDSVAQYVATLKEEHKGRHIKHTPLKIDNLNQIEFQDDRFYFGVLTVGTNVDKATLKDENGNEIISIIANSQIVEFFAQANFYDSTPSELANPVGHFRGFEINIR